MSVHFTITTQFLHRKFVQLTLDYEFPCHYTVSCTHKNLEKKGMQYLYRGGHLHRTGTLAPVQELFSKMGWGGCSPQGGGGAFTPYFTVLVLTVT